MSRAIAMRRVIGDMMHDEEIDRHQSQTVILNVRTKGLIFLSGGTICKYSGLWATTDLKRCVLPPGKAWRGPPPFVQALNSVIKRDGKTRKTRLNATKGHERAELTTLTWIYASSAVRPMLIVREFSNLSIGYGADVTIFGVDHTAVVNPRDLKPLATKNQLAGGHSWKNLLSFAAVPGKMCQKPAICLLRGVIHNGWMPNNETLYRDFADEAARSTAAVGGHYLNPLNATASGIRMRVLEHPDGLRIHYNDRGREFLAQLLLNSLATLLPPRQGTEGSRGTSHGDGDAGYLRLEQPAPLYRNVWRACASEDQPQDLKRACAACPPCRNASLEHAYDPAYEPKYE